MNMRLLPTIFLTLASPALFAHGFLAVEERPLIQMNNYYPFGSHYEGGVSATWLREGEFQDANLFQVKELISQTGCLPAVASAEAGHDFGSRMYWADLGRWFATDPQKQFSSPYTAMGNIPTIAVDPNGELAWFVPLIIGSVLGGTSQGIITQQNGGNFFDGFWKGALTGAAAGAVGIGATAWAAGTSFTAVGSATATIGAGHAALGGIASGAFSGGLGAALSGGDLGSGIWQGALGGAIGSLAGVNVPGIISGAAVGAVSGGFTSGFVASLTGGDFWDGFSNGAIGGAISSGIFGGITAAESKYERSLLFGGATLKGKTDFITDFLAARDASNNGLTKWTVDNTLPKGTNGITTPEVNGSNILLPDAYKITGGVKSNIRIKIQDRSLRAIGSTLSHEFTHVSDLYSGYANSYYTRNGGNASKTQLHLEIRAYRANVAYGFNQAHYLKDLIRLQGSFNQRYY